MTRIFKRSLALLLTFVLILSLAPLSAFAEEPAGDADGIPLYNDVGSGNAETYHWAQDAINRWSLYGVLSGYDGLFRPNDPITRAEFAAVMNRVIGYQTSSDQAFADVPSHAWYAADVSKLCAAGVILGDGNGVIRPMANITREEAAVMLARAFGIDPQSAGMAAEYTVFTDHAGVSDWAAAAIASLEEKDYISGYPDGSFGPKNTITRAEIVTILNNMTTAYYNAPGEYEGDVNGNVIVSSAGVTLKNMKITGDLYIMEGVGDGDVALENVEVAGHTYVRGGGANSIHFNGCNITELVITKTEVRVVLSDGSIVKWAISENSDGIFELHDSTVATLTIIGENITVAVDAKSSIDTLNADAGGISVAMEKGSTITNANLNGSTEITGTGIIQNANVNTNDCSIETKPEKTSLADNVSANIGGQTQTGSGASSGSGGSSGSGSGSTTPAYASHNAPNKPNTPFGTLFSALGLPEQVTLTATTGATAIAVVTWMESDYNPQTEGAQAITGTVSAVQGGTLPSWAPASISVTVTVLARPVPATIQIVNLAGGDPQTQITKGGSETYYTRILDQYGAIMNGQTVIWSIDPGVAGVSVGSETGVVAVTAGCAASGFTLKAVSGSASQTLAVTLGASASKVAPVTDVKLDFNSFGGGIPIGAQPCLQFKEPADITGIAGYDIEIRDTVNEQSFTTIRLNTYQASALLSFELGRAFINDIGVSVGSYTVSVTSIAQVTGQNSDPVELGKTIVVSENYGAAPEITSATLDGIGENNCDITIMLNAAPDPASNDMTAYLAVLSGDGIFSLADSAPLFSAVEMSFMFPLNQGSTDLTNAEIKLYHVDKLTYADLEGETVNFRLSPVSNLAQVLIQ